MELFLDLCHHDRTEVVVTVEAPRLVAVLDLHTASVKGKFVALRAAIVVDGVERSVRRTEVVVFLDDISRKRRVDELPSLQSQEFFDDGVTK